jgi:hypothetical protein
MIHPVMLPNEDSAFARFFCRQQSVPVARKRDHFRLYAFIYLLRVFIFTFTTDTLAARGFIFTRIGFIFARSRIIF